MEEGVLHEAEVTKYYEIGHWSKVGRRRGEAVVNRIWTMDLQKPPIVVTSRDIPSHLTAPSRDDNKENRFSRLRSRILFSPFLEH